MLTKNEIRELTYEQKTNKKDPAKEVIGTPMRISMETSVYGTCENCGKEVKISNPYTKTIDFRQK